MIKFFKIGSKNRLPMGTKEQGGPETFKFKALYNETDKKFFISLTSRKTFHTARMNLTTEEFKVILDSMVSVYEKHTTPPFELQKDIGHVDPDDEMKSKAYEGYENIP